MRTFALLLTVIACSSVVQAKELTGLYLEARTCQVYTGPCFANSETALTGSEAVMAWKIETGSVADVDVAGLSVVVVVAANDTLSHDGLDAPEKVKSIVLVDEKASEQQREALMGFVKAHAGRAGEQIVAVRTMPIDFELNRAEVKGRLFAGDEVRLETRKARKGDCICSNEVAYYPPLAETAGCAAGVTTVGEFKGNGLGVKWSIPNSRSAYLGRFEY